ncbi:DUF4097 family beta strand repeat-containing protein [Streptomyces sp. NPDC004838]
MSTARRTGTHATGSAPAGSRSAGRRAGRALALIGGGGAVLLALTGCGSANADEAPQERKSFALEGKSLEIDSDNSVLEIVPADVREVEVTRQVDGWVFAGSGPEKSWKLEGGKLTLRLSCEAVMSDCEGRHTVKVPRDVSVSVNSENGDVTASGFGQPLKIRSGNGDVDVRETTGELDLAADNGRLTTDDVTVRHLKASSQNGKVRIGLKAGTAAERIEATSDNGKVTVELAREKAPYAVTAETDNGSVDVDVPRDESAPHVVIARSENGDVTVRGAE